MQAALLFAQFDKGTKTIGGDIKYSNTTEFKGLEDPNSHTLEIKPDFGVFLFENTELGLGLGYSWGKISYTVTAFQSRIKNIAKFFIISPYIRQYKKLGDNFAFFGELSPTIISGTSKTTNDGEDKGTDKLYAFEAEFTPGLVFFPHEKVGIEFTIGSISYTKSKVIDQDDHEEKKDPEFSIDLGTVGLGVRYYF